MKPHRRFARAGLRVLALSAEMALCVWLPMDAHAQARGSGEAAESGRPARIRQVIDEKNLVLVKGNVHPLARPEYDQGAVSDGLQLHRMLLLLQRSPDQEASLEKLLDDQQDKSSPNYHVWLTPQQFGQQFGPADADILTVTSWLQSHGFQVANVSAGRTLIEFSGTAGQVRNAFHTEIHSYSVYGEAHTANVTDPQIPVALAPVVVGPVSLNNFPISSHLRRVGTFQRAKESPLAKPLLTFPGCTPAGCFALGPADFATIYNSAPLLSGTPKIDGTGQTIAIVGESDIDPTDVTDFQTMFGMTPNFSAANNIIVNGADPGFNGSEGESDLDVQWASAVAPGATVKFVTSEPTETTAGIFLSATYIVENNLAGVMSESFGGCEQQIGTLNQFHNLLWEQAAAQGITVILSAGDGGSAGCDNFDTAQTATRGLAVSGFAATPFNIAVGGTDFDDINRWSQFWSSTNASPGQSSALSYIPEIPWNDSCAQLGINGCGASAPNGSLNIVAGSGGVSTLYPKPSWQSGIGVPLDNRRDVPDVSLFASNGFDGTFYVICQKDTTGVASCNLGSPFFTFEGIGGTSASAPAFAGIMALVNQSQATTTPANPAPRQGNANYVLYKLFQKQSGVSPAINCNSSTTPSTSCTFYDVTRGNSALPGGIGTNSVPCTTVSPNCSSQLQGETNGVLVTAANSNTPAYSTTTGYDLVTGLGSVNIANLVKNWSSVTSLSSTTTLTVNGQTAAITGTHGTAVTVSSTVAASQGGSGTPSGQVALLATPNPSAGSPGPSLGFDPLTLDTSGTATGAGVVLPGGQYNLTAHYQGDGTFGSSDSTPPISVNMSAETSKTFANLVTLDINGIPTSFSASNATYGSGYFLLRVDVGDSGASVSPSAGISSRCSNKTSNCPSGTIMLTSSGSPLNAASLSLNNLGYAEEQSLNPGTYAVTADYQGDSSYGPSASSVSFGIAKAPTTLTAGFAGTPVQYGDSEQIAADVLTTSDGAEPTGTFQFLVDGMPVGNPVPVFEGSAYSPGGNPPNYAWADASSSTAFMSVGTHTLSAQYSGDSNYLAAVSPDVTVTVSKALPTIGSWGASPATTNINQQVTLIVQMSGSSAGVGPTGTFTFSDGNTPLSGSVTYTSSAHGLGGSMPYTPTTAGTHSINVGYSGDSNYLPVSSPVPATLTVIGPDFSITSTGSTNQTVNAGQTANFQNVITVSAMNGFTGQVAVSCTSPAQATSCSVNPATLNAGQSASVMVTTATRGSEPPIVWNRRIISWPRVLPISVLALLLCWMLARMARSRRQRLVVDLPLAGMVLFLALQAIGCGGGSATPPPPPPPIGTQAGTYTITVTGTSGNLTHATTLTLVVN